MYTHLSIEEREAIQAGLWVGQSLRSLALQLGRSHSSLVRELRRNLPPQVHRYTPRLAHERALAKRSSRGRAERLKNGAVRAYVVAKLKGGWSPEQISGRIGRDLGERVSHEAIYQYVYAQVHRDGYGLLRPGKEDLRPYLKRRHRRRTKKGMRKGQRVLKLKGPRIEGRPIIVERRSRLGDWEGDSIESCNHAPGLNSLVDRKSGLLLLTKVQNRTAAATATVVIQRLAGLPCRTLTTDNGSENQAWEGIQDATGARCFFAHSYSSWERGTNENTNGLVRWYFPKGTDFRTVPDEDITSVEYALNTRPRKRLGWSTPLEAFTRGGALRS
jgi:IS30 family transposase